MPPAPSADGPRDERGRDSGNAGARSFGPLLGGVIVDNFSWRWIFYVNVPVGIVAFIAALRILPRGGRSDAGRLDVLGLAFMSTGLALLTYGLAEVGTTGHFLIPRVLVPLFVGIGLVIAFVFHALRVPKPLLDLHLYRRATFAAASGCMFLLGGALFGGLVLLPLYWQEVRGESVAMTGLLTAPMGIGMVLVMPLAGRLTDRYGGGPLALMGVTITTLATIPFAMIGAQTSILTLSIAMIVRGMGVGFAFMPAMTAAYASLKRSELPDATPQLNVIQRVGGSIGTALLAVILQRALAGAVTPTELASGFGTAFWCATAITAVAIIPCFFLWRAERAVKRDALAAPIGALAEGIA